MQRKFNDKNMYRLMKKDTETCTMFLNELTYEYFN